MHHRKKKLYSKNDFMKPFLHTVIYTNEEQQGSYIYIYKTVREGESSEFTMATRLNHWKESV